MYKTILAPLDGSTRAEAILSHVEELALRTGAKVVFLQVIESTPLLVGPDIEYVEKYQELLDQLLEEKKESLNKIREDFTGKGIEADIFVSHGPVVEEIVKVAKDEDADLVAIASHGHTGLKRVFYGSVAAGVLHRIDRPLLIIRSV